MSETPRHLRPERTLAERLSGGIAELEPAIEAVLMEKDVTIAALRGEVERREKARAETMLKLAELRTRACNAEARLSLMDGQMPQVGLAMRKLIEADDLLKSVWAAWKPEALSPAEPEEPCPTCGGTGIEEHRWDDSPPGTRPCPRGCKPKGGDHG